MRAMRMLIGAVIGGGGVFAAGMAAPEVLPISQAEGAWAMGVAFVWTPLGALLGALGGALWPRRRG